MSLARPPEYNWHNPRNIIGQPPEHQHLLLVLMRVLATKPQGLLHKDTADSPVRFQLNRGSYNWSKQSVCAKIQRKILFPQPSLKAGGRKHLFGLAKAKQRLSKRQSLNALSIKTPNTTNTFQALTESNSWGIGFRGRCIQGVTSLKTSLRLTRVTGSNSVYQRKERILFPVCTNAALFQKTKTTRRK